MLYISFHRQPKHSEFATKISGTNCYSWSFIFMICVITNMPNLPTCVPDNYVNGCKSAIVQLWNCYPKLTQITWAKNRPWIGVLLHFDDRLLPGPEFPAITAKCRATWWLDLSATRTSAMIRTTGWRSPTWSSGPHRQSVPPVPLLN